MSVPIIRINDMPGVYERLSRPWHENYLAMYSSILGGIVTDPVLMTVPADDHLVHRGDGVFDAFKCVNGNAYSMAQHLERLKRSAHGIDLSFPEEFSRIEELIRETAQAGVERSILIRVIVSRGPGGFSTNPYECPDSHLYIMALKLHSPAEIAFREGVTMISTSVPVKSPPLANIKSCDYLTNVLVKKAAIDAGLQYGVSWDRDGNLAEGSIENVLLVSRDNELLIPEFDRILRGVTALRVMDLAEELVDRGLLKGVSNASINRAAAESAKEVFLCGTTIDVLPVTRWDDRMIGDGGPGPITKRLMVMLNEDMASNPDRLTPLFE